ncbi:enoyl-CoA hydratase-related protein [Amycolatopsis sp. NPDC051372]|uniref:enoyl-CoA hydratase/isomerase family protein n=1 Tax=Amycolatopsis sp. NPDC051372 TaxID=3155669 RepID=UPI0034316C24
MSSGSEAVRFSADGPVGRITIDQEATRNALSPEVIAGLDKAITAAGECSVVVVRGRGGTLSAGAELKFLRSVLDDPAAVREYITSIGVTLDRLESAPFVSVCVIDGYAVAGGCEIMLACDLAVVSETAQIGDRHLEYGLLPGAGGSVRLTHAVAPAIARRLLYTGEIVDGATAAGFGLVSSAVPAAELDDAVDALVARLARHAPDALRGMKRLHRKALADEPAAAITAERETLLAHLAGASAREGLAAFAERRAPRFGSL